MTSVGTRTVNWPERHPLIALLILHLFLERELHGLRTHLEHSFDVVVCSMVVQTIHPGLCAMQDECSESKKNLLPEAKFSRSLPQLLYFGGILLHEESVVNDEQRVRREAFREWQIVSQARHDDKR